MASKPARLGLNGFLLRLTVTGIFLLYACGGHSSNESSASDTGALSFSIAYQRANGGLQPQAAVIDCTGLGIATVEAAIYDTADVWLAGGGPWACDTGTGTITSVPAGGDRIVVILGKDSAGNVIFRGEKHGIAIDAHSENNAGTIDCYSFTPHLQAPADGAAVNADAMGLSWSAVTGASQYRVIVSANSNLSVPIIDETVATENFTPTGLAEGQTYYWQVVAGDSYANEGVGSLVWSFAVEWVKLYGTDDNDRAMDIIINGSNNNLSIGGRIRNTQSPINDKTFISIISSTNGDTLQFNEFDNDFQDYIISMAYDSDDNTYITGYYNNVEDIFITKYNSDFDELWTVMLDEDQDLSSKDIAVDFSNNVYIAGSTRTNLSTYQDESAKGARDIFAAKYNSEGATEWIHQLGTNCDDFGTAIVIDSDNNIYVTGTTFCELVPGEDKDGLDYFIVKYNSAGEQQWLRQYGDAGAGDESCHGIEIDSEGYLYVTGDALSDAFIAKIDSKNGNEVWEQPKFFGAKFFADSSNDIAIDSKDNIYITGYTLGDVENDEAQSLGETDIFIAKLTPEGIFTSKQIGTAEYDYAQGIAIDSSDTPYVTGYTSGNLGGKKVLAGEDAFIWKVLNF